MLMSSVSTVFLLAVLSLSSCHYLNKAELQKNICNKNEEEERERENESESVRERETKLLTWNQKRKWVGGHLKRHK